MNSNSMLHVDGGWAWVVFASSFGIRMIASGLHGSFPVFFVAFLDAFHSNKALTAAIGSLNIGIYFVLGNVYL